MLFYTAEKKLYETRQNKPKREKKNKSKRNTHFREVSQQKKSKGEVKKKIACMIRRTFQNLHTEQQQQ